MLRPTVSMCDSAALKAQLVLRLNKKNYCSDITNLQKNTNYNTDIVNYQNSPAKKFLDIL